MIKCDIEAVLVNLFKEFADVDEAIAREKHLKGWLRAKKDELIATVNPDKKDLAEALGW